MPIQHIKSPSFVSRILLFTALIVTAICGQAMGMNEESDEEKVQRLLNSASESGGSSSNSSSPEEQQSMLARFIRNNSAFNPLRDAFGDAGTIVHINMGIKFMGKYNISIWEHLPSLWTVAQVVLLVCCIGIAVSWIPKLGNASLSWLLETGNTTFVQTGSELMLVPISNSKAFIVWVLMSVTQKDSRMCVIS